MAKKKSAKFKEVEWFVWQSETIRDLLWSDLRNDNGWKWKQPSVKSGLLVGPFEYPFDYRHKSILITVGQSQLTIDISLFGQGSPARSIGVEIKESAQSIGTFEHICRQPDPIMNIRRVVEMTMYFITREFVGDDRERFYPPKPPKPCPEAELNKDFWLWDEG
jgi:hypothetical protein